jgi:hypothetical protein
VALSADCATEREWLADFAEAQARLPFWLSPLLRPRMVFLPCWWPNSIGAWSYLQFVFIGAGVLDAPDDVRHYLVAHEYGHIHGNHTVLHFLYWLGALLLMLVYVGQLSHVPHLTVPGLVALLLLAAVTFMIGLPSLQREREYQADAVAALLYGRSAALAGSLWMAEKTGNLSNAFRQSRLRRLGWQS